MTSITVQQTMIDAASLPDPLTVEMAAKEAPAKEGMLAYAAPTLYQPHRTRQAIRDAHAKKIPPLVCYYAGLSSLPITRYVAPMGYDAVWIDWEHTPCGVETMTDMVHEAIFMSGGRTIPFVRVPQADHAAIGWALDAGASIIVPQVETVEQAKLIVSSAKFGAKNNGSRSVPPFRYLPGLTDATHDPGADLHRSLNEQSAIMIQIETRLGVDNLDAILTACPDIDIVWLGQLDLRVSMSLPHNLGMGGDEPEWLETVALFEETMAKHDKPRGSFGYVGPPVGSKDVVKQAVKKGFSLVITAADVIQLYMMAPQLMEARAVIAETMAEMRGEAKREGENDA